MEATIAWHLQALALAKQRDETIGSIWAMVATLADGSKVVSHVLVADVRYQRPVFLVLVRLQLTQDVGEGASGGFCGDAGHSADVWQRLALPALAEASAAAPLDDNAAGTGFLTSWALIAGIFQTHSVDGLSDLKCSLMQAPHSLLESRQQHQH
jgi:hypothetical protein